MNRIHRLVFNRATGVCQAVSEIAISAQGGAGSAAESRATRPSLSRLTAACLMALSAMALTPAWADGGRGGNNFQGDAGGAGGTTSQPLGGNGGERFSGPYFAGAGGGGGATDVNGVGAAGGLGGGDHSGGSGLGGAGGAVGTAAEAGTTIAGTVLGGSGSNGNTATSTPGGIADGGGGGGGGGAAAAVFVTGELTITGSLVGGSGGAGGNAGGPGTYGGGGGGGQGATGLIVSGTGATVTNTGAVRGGNGGATSSGGAGGPGSAGTAGYGIQGADLTLINSGTIAGGIDSTGQAAAVLFTGGVNSLELRAGSLIESAVQANGTSDTLTLGGADAASFDLGGIGAQYLGFEAFTKTGASVWTVTGTLTQGPTLDVREGTLLVGDGDGTNASIVGAQGTFHDRIVTPYGGLGQAGGAGAVGLTVSGGTLAVQSSSTVNGGNGADGSETYVINGSGLGLGETLTGARGGDGAAAVVVTNGSFSNAGEVQGGSAGQGGETTFSDELLGRPAQPAARAAAAEAGSLVGGAGGNGGDGVSSSAGTAISNTGSIRGGNGGNGGYGSGYSHQASAGPTSVTAATGGSGGHGIAMTAATSLDNSGFVAGGLGGSGSNFYASQQSTGDVDVTGTHQSGGAGGTGALFAAGGTLTNNDVILGGDAGGSSYLDVDATATSGDGTTSGSATATVTAADGAKGGDGAYFGGAATVTNNGGLIGGTGAGSSFAPTLMAIFGDGGGATSSYATASSQFGAASANAAGNRGGNGGNGLVLAAGGTVSNLAGAGLIGGNGGSGAGAVADVQSNDLTLASAVSTGGRGGDGGNGAVLNGVTAFVNDGSVAGGAGGTGGSAESRSVGPTDVPAATRSATGGDGGAGGAAIVASASTLVNRGAITGGHGGLGGSAVLTHYDNDSGNEANAAGISGTSGAGGVGVTGANLAILNAGTITGGLSGDGNTRAAAVAFTGGVNSLTLEASSVLVGNALAFSAADVLALGGATDGSFDVATIGADAQYRGFGDFRKTGDSTWTLTGATAAVTPWTVQTGTLAIASDASLGDASGLLTLAGGTLQTTADIRSTRPVALSAAGGTLRTDAGTTLALNGAVSGTGALTKDGAGTLRLGGTNSYSGGTLIAAGTLVGGVNSFGSGAIVDNAALVLDQATDATLANTLSGTGTLTKDGTGIVRYTGDGSGFTGTTQVNGGTLSVNGVLGGATTIASGAVLRGNGTVGSTVLLAGATVAPGNSIGTLTVNGDLTFSAGSSYQVETAPSGASDLIRVTGTATLGGASVVVLAADGTWGPVTRYTILTSGNRVGTFGGVTSNFAFLSPMLTYVANDVQLTLERNAVLFPTVGVTPNQKAAAAALESLGTGTLYNAVVQLNAATARSAFDQLSGELHASVRSSLTEDSRFVREAGIDRLRQSQGGATDLQTAEGTDGAAWGRVYGAWGHMNGDGNAAKVDRNTRGILVGADRRVDSWRLGVMAGAGRSDVDVDQRNASAKIDNYHLGVYGGTEWGALGLRTGASYTHHRIDTDRSVAFTGLAGQTEAGYDARTAQLFGELGWRIDAGTVALEPFANLAYVNLHTDSFNERGGVTALSGRGQTSDTTFSTLGLRASTKLDMGIATGTTLRGLLGWRHAFGDVKQTSDLAFATGSAFSVAGVPVAKDAAVIEAGVDFALRTNLTLGVSYAGQLGDGVKDHGVKASLLWKF